MIDVKYHDCYEISWLLWNIMIIVIVILIVKYLIIIYQICDPSCHCNDSSYP